MDISDTLAPKSDQLDGVDLIGSPRTFSIASVNRGSAEQPINIHLAEFPRAWRPGVTMRRILATAWGVDASVYVGRRVTLYYDPDVRFGKEKPGGTRISHLSHIDKPLTLTLPTSKGKFGEFTVQPLKDDPAPTPSPEPTAEQVAASTSQGELRAWWSVSGPERQEQIEARAAELTERAS